MKSLVLSPHTDDGELGLGGSIVKFIEEGHEVFYDAFSKAEESVKKGFLKDPLKTKVKNATKVLGIKPKNLFAHDYKVRSFLKNRQEILEQLVAYRKELQPDVVFRPNRDDMHQDHQIKVNEGIRVFRVTSSIYGYEFPRNNITLNATFFIKLEKRHSDKKVAAIKEYKNQEDKSDANEDRLQTLAQVRSIQLDHPYTEAFVAIRVIFDLNNKNSQI